MYIAQKLALCAGESIITHTSHTTRDFHSNSQKPKKKSKLHLRTKYAFFLEVEQFAPVMVDFPVMEVKPTIVKKSSVELFGFFRKDHLYHVYHAQTLNV